MADRPRLLFVDDDPRVLEGLENLLFDRTDAWDLAFVVGGAAAIRHLAADAAIDVVITDMRMAGVDGLHVLREAAAHHAGAMRIVLSGHAELEKAIQALAIAHDYLSKPCDEATLVAAIERALRLQRAVAGTGLRPWAGNLDYLVTSEAASAELRRLLRMPQPRFDDIAAVAGWDAGLTGKLLHVARGCGAFTAPPPSLRAAVQALGLDGVRAVLSSLDERAAPSAPDREPCAEIHRHAQRLGQIASALCPDPVSAEQAKLCGLMHGLGPLALATRLPEGWRRSRVPTLETRGIDRERRELGIDHGALGAALLELWQMAACAEVIGFHHQPSRAPRCGAVLVALHLAEAALDGGARELDAALMRSLGADGAALWGRAQHLAEVVA